MSNTDQCAMSTLLSVPQALDYDTDACQFHGRMNKNQDTPGALIRAAREGLKWTQTDLARRIGTKQQTIEKIELGKVKHTRLFPKLAAELGLDPRKLMPDLVSNTLGGSDVIPESDLRSETRDFPVHAATQGGAGELIMSSDPVSWILRPVPLLGVSRAYGIIVVGESMVPEFRPGDTALVHPHLPPERYETFVFYAEGEGDVRCTIKHLIRWTETTWHVRQWNPAKGQKADFQLPRKEWGRCHMVVGRYRP